MIKASRLSCAQGLQSHTDIFLLATMQILCKCFSVPRLSDFLAFRLLLFCKCRGLQKTEGAEDL